MLYDVAPGELIETPDDELLDEDELADARARLEAGDKLAKIAKDLGATVWKPTERPPANHVAVDYDALVAMVGEDKARDLVNTP